MCAILSVTCLMTGNSLMDNPEGLDIMVNKILPLSIIIVLFELLPDVIGKIVKDKKARLVAVSGCMCFGMMVFATLIGGKNIQDSTTILIIYIACIAAVFLGSKALKWFILTKKKKEISAEGEIDNDNSNKVF